MLEDSIDAPSVITRRVTGDGWPTSTTTSTKELKEEQCMHRKMTLNEYALFWMKALEFLLHLQQICTFLQVRGEF